MSTLAKINGALHVQGLTNNSQSHHNHSCQVKRMVSPGEARESQTGARQALGLDLLWPVPMVVQGSQGKGPEGSGR